MDQQETVGKEKKVKIIVFIVLFLLLTLGAKLWQYRWPKMTIVLKDTQLHVLVADTPLHRYQGLGKRETLAPYEGMLFLYPEAGRHGIVMRDMHFPIDVVWFLQGEVIDIAANVALEPGVPEDQLRGYFPRKEADMFLELPAGWTQEHQVKIGDRLRAS